MPRQIKVNTVKFFVLLKSSIARMKKQKQGLKAIRDLSDYKKEFKYKEL